MKNLCAVLVFVACGGCHETASPNRPTTASTVTAPTVQTEPEPAAAGAPAAEPVAEPVAAEPVEGPHLTLLAELKARLDRVRAAAPDEHLTEAPINADGLVGMERAVIVQALQAPHECAMDDVTSCSGTTLRCRTERVATPAPCGEEDDVFYSFYHLPDTWVGGGPELRLRFDDDDRCASAMWFHTQ